MSPDTITIDAMEEIESALKMAAQIVHNIRLLSQCGEMSPEEAVTKIDFIFKNLNVIWQ